MGDTLTVPLTNLFERLSASDDVALATNPNLATYAILGNITFEYGIAYASDNAKIKSITALAAYHTKTAETRNLEIKFGEFNNSLSIVIYIRCNGEILGERISIKVVPQNLQVAGQNAFTYYNGQKAIVVSNGQTIKTASSNWFEDLFISGTVSCDDSFYSTYTTTESGNTKVVFSANVLFEDTNKKVTVTQNGISSTYTIVISKLAFPFVDFVDQSDAELPYANLDIYRLFVDTSDILAYYQEAQIKSFMATAPDAESEPVLLLADTSSDNLAVFNLKPFGAASTIYNSINFNSTLGAIEVLQGSLTANNYATFTHNSTDGNNGCAYLNVNPVGEDVYLKVTVYLMPNGSTTYYEIPVVVKIEVSQTLRVTYPFSNLYKDSTDTNYGSDVYDSEFMTANASTFEESYKYMEYLSFNINGLAQVNLVDSNYNRFTVYKGATLDTDYNGAYKFEVVKVTKNVNGAWSFVGNNELKNYAYFEDGSLYSSTGLLTISNINGGSAFRVKIKVTTTGGAVSYYYVSVGEQVPLTLMRQKGTTNVSVGTSDSITITAGKVLLIGSANGAGYSYADVNPEIYYYISNTAYNKELNFRVFDINNNIVLGEDIKRFVTVDVNKLVVSVQPMGTKFIVQIYTSYGVLSTVTVDVEPSISVSLTAGTIYSGSSYAFSEIITITNGAGVGTVSIVKVTSKTASIYYSCLEDAISFANIPAGESKVFDMLLEIEVKIDGINFVFEHKFSAVTLVPRIIAKTFNDGFYRDDTESQLTTYTEDSGMVEISNQLWKKMFSDLKSASDIVVENETELEFIIDGVNVTESITASAITWTLPSVLVDDDVRNWTFAIKDKKTGVVIASAYAKITIKPQYDVVIRYCWRQRFRTF